MKKLNTFSALSFLFILSVRAFALDLNNPLPNWIDPTRERADGKLPLINVVRSKAMPAADFRIPAEYEPVGAVVISWAGYTGMLTSIARAAAGPGRAQVWGVAAPTSIAGVPSDKYSSIDLPIDTVWVRDYGPFGLSGQGRLGIVDTIYRHYQYRRDDDAMPASLGSAKKIEVFGMPIIVDGGNIMVDSKGNLFMTKRTYMWNSNMQPEQVDAALKTYFRVKNIYAFEYAGYPGQPMDGTGHIDMFMKLLNDHTVLISMADTEPFKSNAEKAAAFFKGRMAPDGVPYTVIPVKGWYSYRTWYTYTNSLIVNNVVIMPAYSSNPAENSKAKAAYEQGMPGVTVVPVPSDESIGAGGSIHCVTQTIPVMTRGYGNGYMFTKQPVFDGPVVTGGFEMPQNGAQALEQLKYAVK